MTECEFCLNGDDVEAQDMGEGRTMMLCVQCRANIAENEARAVAANLKRAERDLRLGEPMSDARLREIRKGIEIGQMWMDEDDAIEAISDLLAEVDRLRSRELPENALVELADGRLSYSEQPDGWVCALCDAFTPSEWGRHEYRSESESESDRAKRVIQHDADCPVMLARAKLASPEER